MKLKKITILTVIRFGFAVSLIILSLILSKLSEKLLKKFLKV